TTGALWGAISMRLLMTAVAEGAPPAARVMIQARLLMTSASLLMIQTKSLTIQTKLLMTPARLLMIPLGLLMIFAKLVTAAGAEVASEFRLKCGNSGPDRAARCQRAGDFSRTRCQAGPSAPR